MSGAFGENGRAPHPATVAQPKMPHPARVVQRREPHAARVVQPKAAHPAQMDPASIQQKKRWTDKQRAQSEQFWEKKGARLRRRAEADQTLRQRERERDSKGHAKRADELILKEFPTVVLESTSVNPDYCVLSRMRILSEEEYAEVYAQAAVEEILFTHPDTDAETLEGVRSFAKSKVAKEHAVTTNGHIYVKKAHYELETLVHEGIHLYGRDYFSHNACNRDSQGINEGMTEYFARKALGVKKRQPYKDECKTATSIVRLVGFNVAKDAYFHNRIAEFKDAYFQAVGVIWEEDYAWIKTKTKGGDEVVPKSKR